MSLPTHHSGTVAIERRLHGDADSLWKSTLPTAAKGSEEEMAFPSLRGHTQPHARTHTHSLPVPWPLPSVSYRRRVVLACSHDLQPFEIRCGTIDVALTQTRLRKIARRPYSAGADGRSRCSPTHRLTVDADAFYKHTCRRRCDTPLIRIFFPLRGQSS